MVGRTSFDCRARSVLALQRAEHMRMIAIIVMLLNRIDRISTCAATRIVPDEDISPIIRYLTALRVSLIIVAACPGFQLRSCEQKTAITAALGGGVR
jgi:hypothetical protein